MTLGLQQLDSLPIEADEGVRATNFTFIGDHAIGEVAAPGEHCQTSFDRLLIGCDVAAVGQGLYGVG